MRDIDLVFFTRCVGFLGYVCVTLEVYQMRDMLLRQVHYTVLSKFKRRSYLGFTCEFHWVIIRLLKELVVLGVFMRFYGEF